MDLKEILSHDECEANEAVADRLESNSSPRLPRSNKLQGIFQLTTNNTGIDELFLRSFLI